MKKIEVNQAEESLQPLNAEPVNDEALDALFSGNVQADELDKPQASKAEDKGKEEVTEQPKVEPKKKKFSKKKQASSKKPEQKKSGQKQARKGLGEELIEKVFNSTGVL